jgi:thiamine-phosphate pyrophosphorylase
MKKFVDTFHYLTQDLPNISHVAQVEMACSQGAKWVQYRCLSKSDEEMLAEIHQIASICDDWGTTLIVTNHVHLVHQADIQGVHIEDMDADISLVRAQIGDDKTLGASANDLATILKHIQNGADYIGCGPFGHTETKPNNCQHWSIQGYAESVAALKQAGIDFPLIAAGGVGLNDVADLLKTGIKGVAVSAAVNKAEHPAEAFKQFYNLLH